MTQNTINFGLDIVRPNLELSAGEGEGQFLFYLTVKRTLRNRLKYWLFCFFFPFKIKRWTNHEARSP